MIDDWEEEEERRICVDIDMRGAGTKYEANRLSCLALSIAMK